MLYIHSTYKLNRELIEKYIQDVTNSFTAVCIYIFSNYDASKSVGVCA